MKELPMSVLAAVTGGIVLAISLFAYSVISVASYRKAK
jgi:hypothetical protein